MRLIDPNRQNGGNGPRPPAIPSWYKEWLSKYGRYVELNCTCIVDINLPECISILSSKPEIECPNGHGFRRIKRNVRFREILWTKYQILIPADNDPEGNNPPF